MPQLNAARGAWRVRQLEAKDIGVDTAAYTPAAPASPTAPDLSNYDLSTLPRAIHARLRERGLIFELEFIEAFLLALKTKPFLILSGISGTGKTALPRALGEMVGNRVQPIAVAPDWTDNADMLGYFDLESRFIEGEFTTLVKEAAAHPHKPFFVVLDEMNLARVEYYFAQVLSVLESRAFDEQTGQVHTKDLLFNRAVQERLSAEGLDDLAELRIGPNVYIIGTVNVDETTHPFSKKVLDRANVLEVGEVSLLHGVRASLTTPDLAPAPSVPSHNHFFAGKATDLEELKTQWSQNAASLPVEDTIEMWVERLEEFAGILRPLKLHFGFRVRDEVCIYLYHAATLDPVKTGVAHWWHPHFDRQLVQKVLTRFGGEQGQIEPYIVTLFNLCIAPAPPCDENAAGGLDVDALAPAARFPRAAKKLQRMLHEVTAEDKPSTSFWTA